MKENSLINMVVFDGKGGGKELDDWQQLPDHSSGEEFVWAHLDYTDPESIRWLEEESGLDPLTIESLEAQETRPRCVPADGGLLIILRGVNMNPGAEPEDMVSIRIFIDSKRVISTRHRKLLFINDMRERIKIADAPCTTGEFLVFLLDSISDRIATVSNEIDDRVDRLEEEVLTAESYQLRSRIAEIRRETISLRRYLAPQREAVSRLHNEHVEWLTDRDRLGLREISDRTMRFIEDLDSARERASVTHEELMSRLSEQMDRRMYVLSIVAAVFLPLGFLTGLLGINVGGIPGAENKDAFILFLLMLIIVVLLQIIIFKWKKWM